MINKNVADYTNFEGKTNKKIVQAPGGQSSVSLAWSNDPINYGPQRVIKKNKPDPYGQMENMNPPSYQPSSKPLYSEPIKVMEDPHQFQRKTPYYRPSQNPISQESTIPIGGEYGYQQGKRSAQYKPIEKQVSRNSYGNYGQTPQQLDIAVYQQKIQKNQRPPSVPRLPPNNNKACIKMGSPQRHNLIIGDGNYNYWKDTSLTQEKGQSEKKISVQPYVAREQVEKTSVKVKNPPGGKGTFSFG